MKRDDSKPITLIIICLFLLLLLVSLTGCKSKIQYVPIESVRTEYKDKLQRDSIFEKEFVKIYQRGDTVFKDSIVYKYKDKLRTDSVIIRDSIRVPYPVKGDTEYINVLKWWQEASVWFTLLVLVALALYLGIRYRGRIFSFFRKFVFKI